jgi:putative ABC transport system permease protein
MKFVDLFKLSTRMFKARTSRTLLTVLGMSVGIGAILFLVSLGYGLQKTLLEKITTADSLLTLDVSESKSASVIIDNAMVEKIQAISGVEKVSPSFQVKAQASLADVLTDVTVIGTNPTFVKLGGLKLAEGESLDDNQPNGVVVNTSIVKIFGKTNEAVIGQDITFTFFVSPEGNEGGEKKESKEIKSDIIYKIIGVTESEENVVYINSKSLDVLNINRYNQIKVKTRSNGEMIQVRQEIEKMNLLVSSISDTVDQANQVFRVIQIILMSFGIVALVVSAIGMFNTMTIALLERTEEIGIMKSIGASDLGISMMFIMEATIMGFLGGLVGVILGWIGGWAINMAINFIAVRFGGEAVTLFYSPLWFVMTIIIFAAVVGMMTGVVPARRASKIDPLDALRYK